MTKISRFPTLFEDCKTISISNLKQWGYLLPNQYKSGIVTWSINGNRTGSISVVTNTHNESPYLEMGYKCNNSKVNYRVQLVKIPSNLGKGTIWYFVCPRTGRRCRKLHLIDTYFYHRSAFNGCMYEKQTYSKKARHRDNTFGAYFRAEELYEQLNKKHFKKHYAGNPTKRYLRLTNQIRKVKNVPYHEIERL